jgi:HEAT repeat protein
LTSTYLMIDLKKHKEVPEQMTENIPRLGHTIDRFNQGCSFFKMAINAWKDGNLTEYETALRKAATESIGGLEWALKVYLKSICRDRIETEDATKLKQPTFHNLMNLMNKYADPPIEKKTVNLLYGYRDQFRNKAEHDASVPPSEDLKNAIKEIRQVILTYLPVKENQLKEVDISITSDSIIKDLKEEYFKTLQSNYEYMDLGGISPRVGSKVVKIQMNALFIPLQAAEEKSLFESFSEKSLEEVSGSSKSFTLIDESGENGLSEMENLDSSQFETQEGMIRTIHYHPLRYRAVDIAYILRKPRVVVLGHPGSGKTTVGKYVAYCLATRRLDLIGEHLKNHIPVVIKAAEYALSLKENPGLSFYEYVTQKHTTKFGRLFNWILHKGLCLMIIDGLDEIPDASLRNTTSRRIIKFVNEFQTNRFLLTSRIVGYRQNQLGGDFAHFTLNELNKDQIMRFLEQWYTAIEIETGLQADDTSIRQKASGLWGAIISKPGIRRIAGNPLLLTITALANWRGTKLPNKRVELYQIAAETLIENWPLKQRGLNFDSEEILAILEPIAYHIFSSGKINLIGEHELRPLFESQVCEVRGATSSEAKSISRELLQKIQVDTGFFLERGFDESNQSVYGFLHPTFAEYLTARFLAEQWASDQFKFDEYVHNPHWHEVLLLMSGHIGTWATAQATRLVKQILDLESPYEKHIHSDLFFASEILGDNVRVKRELQDKIVSNLISMALSTPHIQLWGSSVRYLSDIARVFQLGKSVTQLEFQKSDDIKTRVKKAVLLVMLGKDTDEILLELLHGLTESEVTHHLVDLFLYSGNILGDQVNVTHILAIQTAAIWSFYRLTEKVAERIKRIYPLLHDVDSLSKKQMSIDKNYSNIWMFSHQDILKIDASKISDLLAASDWNIQSAIFAMLSAEKSHISIWKKFVKEATSDNKIESRSVALEILNWLLLVAFEPLSKNEHEIMSKIAGEIHPLVMKDENPEIRSKALRILSGLPQKPENWEEILYQTLNDSSEMVQLASIAVASQNDSQIPENILNMLKKLLTDSSPVVRKASALALIQIGKFKEEDITILLKEGFGRLPESENTEEWGNQLRYLFLLSNKANSSEMLNAITTKITEYLKKYVFSNEMDDFYWNPPFNYQEIHQRKELTETVGKLLRSPNPVIRAKAITIWSHLIPESVSSPDVISFLMDDSPKVRSATIRSLRSIDLQQSSVVNSLLQLLTSDISKEASSAASELSRIQNPELRHRVITQMVSLLEQSPENENAFKVLWNLKAPQDRTYR